MIFASSRFKDKRQGEQAFHLCYRDRPYVLTGQTLNVQKIQISSTLISGFVFSRGYLAKA